MTAHASIPAAVAALAEARSAADIGPIWVEVLSRHGAVLTRHRCTCSEIRVGRGYGVDVMIDDPLVDPEHLAICRDAAGALVAEDLGSVNGLFLGRGTVRQSRVVLDGERLIRIGGTLLRVREAEHAVVAALPIRRTRRAWPMLLGLGAAVLGLTLLGFWLEETGESKASYYLSPSVMLIAATLLWTAAWALASRLFSSEARFDRHLAIALVGLLSLDLLEKAATYFSFALSWPLLTAFTYVGLWLAGGIVCYRHLRQVAAGGSFRQMAVIAALTLAAIGIHSLKRWEPPVNIDQERYVKRLLPPALRLTAGEPDNALFATADRLRRKLDRDRQREGSAPASGAEDDD
jgi:hypothetical protein